MPGFYPLHFVPMTQARRVGVSAWIAADEVIRAYALPILAELVLQLVSYAYDLLRYRRIASLHAYSAKLWGASLYVSAGALIAFRFGPPIWVSFALGCVSFVDALAIKLILPGWRHDVLSCFHAWKQRGLPPTVGA
jgi:CDP-diacylglycerol--glycerol-3-phosphate 3-phosphatidyltransferase